MAASSVRRPSSRKAGTSTARRSPRTRDRHREEGCSNSRVFERLRMIRWAFVFLVQIQLQRGAFGSALALGAFPLEIVAPIRAICMTAVLALQLVHVLIVIGSFDLCGCTGKGWSRCL